MNSNNKNKHIVYSQASRIYDGGQDI